mmetsp:Transcript_17014/g.19476  ORF Transcript_17014/g.19476 Transcript_17014/m.19476 type:complete len:335 (+) Transcript_17014:147-1151(+)
MNLHKKSVLIRAQSRIMMMLLMMLMLIGCITLLSCSVVTSFSSSPYPSFLKLYHPHEKKNQILLYTSSSSEEDATTVTVSTATVTTNTEEDESLLSELDQSIIEKITNNHFPDFNATNQLLTFKLPNHKPLGFTAEESLNVDPTNGDIFVFISKVKEGGFAEKIGVEVGDVIVALSGSFDEIVDVVFQDLNKVRSLITGRPEEKELIIKVIRYTDVLQKHESTLVDLCILPEGSFYDRDKNMEKCIETMYNANYEIDELETMDDSCGDKDMECMLDTLGDLWNDDWDEDDKDGDKKGDDDVKEVEKNKPAPWSSRSSGSGTYVRINGTMVNIDE